MSLIKKGPAKKSDRNIHKGTGGIAAVIKKFFFYIFLLIILASITYLIVSYRNRPILIQASLQRLSLGELTDSITVRGTVESVSKKNVYAALTGFRIKEVDARKGDRVSEGQVLCVLDTGDLELSLEQQKAQLDSSQKESQNMYENSKRIYDQAKADLESGGGPAAINAKNAVNSAKLTLDNAQRVYDNALNDSQNNTDPNVIAAESALSSVKLELDAKQKAYSDNETLYNNGVISESEYTQYKNAYNDAKNRYDAAQKNLDAARTSQSRALAQAESALNEAKAAYNSALDTYNTADQTARQQLDGYKSSLDQAEIALNQDITLINIKKLEKQLSEATITAPAAGTVTAVYAREGDIAATGLLFVIEDTDHLRITGAVKEYDYPKVSVGMDVIIQPSSNESEEYQGVVSEVDPAAVKDAFGDNSSKSDVEFGITVQITSEQTNLKIGMNANLSLVVEKKSDIYSVRYDAVITDEQGRNIIFTAEGPDSDFKLSEAFVDIGASNDLFLEVSGENIKDGVRYVSDASIIAAELKKYNKTFDKASDLRFRLA